MVSEGAGVHCTLYSQAASRPPHGLSRGVAFTGCFLIWMFWPDDHMFLKTWTHESLTRKACRYRGHAYHVWAQSMSWNSLTVGLLGFTWNQPGTIHHANSGWTEVKANRSSWMYRMSPPVSVRLYYLKHTLEYREGRGGGGGGREGGKQREEKQVMEEGVEGSVIENTEGCWDGQI